MYPIKWQMDLHFERVTLVGKIYSIRKAHSIQKRNGYKYFI